MNTVKNTSNISRQVKEKVSFVILAGGKSRRMGTNKADLKLDRDTFIQALYKKAKRSGFDEILISGYCGADETLSSIAIPDVYPDKGPMSGIYSCMCASKKPHCLVVSVDTPAAAPDLFAKISEYHLEHEKNATLLYYQNMYQTLFAVYSRSLMAEMKKLLEKNDLSMMRIVENHRCAAYNLDGDHSVDHPSLLNINTPEDYAKALTLWHDKREKAFPKD